MKTLNQKIVFCIGLMMLFGQTTVYADNRPNSERNAPSRQWKPAPPARKLQSEHRLQKRWEAPPAPVYKHYYKPGYRVNPLPHGHTRLFINKTPYYFFDGYFYQPSRGGYVVVDAPIGAIVAALPLLHHILHWRGEPYYIVGNTFYRRHPRGYVVVPDPGFGSRRW